MESNAISYRVLESKDEGAVKELIRTVFSQFLGGNYWDWKYKRNPGFDPKLVAVAEKDGRIVGCNHWLIRDLSFPGELPVRTVLGADIAVSPEQRRKGIGKSLLLFLRSSETFKNKGALISYMFPNPDMINPLYRPSAFYIPAPSRNACYVKILNWDKLAAKLEKVNSRIRLDADLQERMADLNFQLLFKIENSPPLPLKISKDGIEISENARDDPNITFRISLETLESLRGAKKKMFILLKAWVTGKLRIRGNLRKLIKLSRNLWIYSLIFG